MFFVFLCVFVDDRVYWKQLFIHFCFILLWTQIHGILH